MAMALFLLLRHRDDPPPPPIFVLITCAVFLLVFAAIILWDRRYRRKWQQFRARNWREVAGRFDEGEIITMRKGSSKAVAGYEIWLAYDYEVDGDQVGIYTLPFSGEFPNKSEAEECRKLIADQSVMVRVSPRNPKCSCV